jgi:hypothetical protein
MLKTVSTQLALASDTLSEILAKDNTSGPYNIAMDSGYGIDFSATPGTGTSELLDDYEEGTWTPVVRGSTTAGTYEIGTNGSTYTKVGRQVTLNVFIQISGSVTGGGTGDLQITAAPFAKSANSNTTAAVYLAIGTFLGNAPIATWQSFGSTSTMLLTQVASSGFGSAIPISFASDGAYIAFTIIYFI